MLFGRVATAMVTPFDKELNIDWPSVKRLVNRLMVSGTDTIVISGTTGESPTLSKEEKLKLISFVIEHTKGKVKVIAGTGSNNTSESIQLTKEAEKLGLDGVMLVAPYYNKPSQLGLLNHFQTIISATSLPVMLYNIPGRTGVNMTVETMISIAEMSNVIAIKESSGDLNQVGTLISKLPEHVSVYSGDDYLTLPILSLGGVGIVSVASHVVGKEIQEMIRLFQTGAVQKAVVMYQKLLPVFQGLFLTSNPVPLKYLLSQQEICEAFVRQPLTEMTAEEKAKTDGLLRYITL